MSARRVTRPLACAIALILLMGAVACSRASAPPFISLIDALPSAERRPATAPPDAFQVTELAVAGEPRRSLSVAVPTRITYTTHIPERAELSAWLTVEGASPDVPSAGASFRVGISDGRIYEQLFEKVVAAHDANRWTPMRIDLSRYAGWQWSLFYHPSTIAWQIVLNTYPTGAGSDHLRGVWGEPVIEGRP
jgi:hypothetical protein